MNKGEISYLRYNASAWLVLIIHLFAFVGVPIFAYRFNNWWFLFGIAFVYIGFSLGWKRSTFKILIFAALGIFLAINNFFSQQIAFFFLCFSFGFVGIRLYRVIGLGDKTSRALISLVNQDVKQEISTEIEEALKKYTKDKNSN